MIVPQQYKCDAPGCTKEHTAVNGWRVVYRTSSHLELYKWEDARVNCKLDGEQSFHFCGQAHALQFVSNEMGA